MRASRNRKMYPMFAVQLIHSRIGVDDYGHALRLSGPVLSSRTLLMPYYLRSNESLCPV